MIHFRVRIDVENLRLRLSRNSGRVVADADTLMWLSQRGITRCIPCSAHEFLAAEHSLQVLEPWEILERRPLISLPEAMMPDAIMERPYELKRIQSAEGVGGPSHAIYHVRATSL